MRRCVEAHDVPGFGWVPLGSLWADDSPFVLEEHADKFETVKPPKAVKVTVAPPTAGVTAAVDAITAAVNDGVRAAWKGDD